MIPADFRRRGPAGSSQAGVQFQEPKRR